MSPSLTCRRGGGQQTVIYFKTCPLFSTFLCMLEQFWALKIPEGDINWKSKVILRDHQNGGLD